MAHPPDPEDLFEAFKFCSKRSDAAAVQCLQAIREHGIVLNTLCDAQANTLLHFAASRGCRVAAEILLRAGLRPQELNASAKSALAIAQDFRGYGKGYRLTYEYLQLYTVSCTGGEDPAQVAAGLGEFEEPPMIERALLKLIGSRVLSEYPNAGHVEAVVQCLENPADPCSALITMSDHGKILKLSRAQACEHMEHRAAQMAVTQAAKPARAPSKARPKVKRENARPVELQNKKHKPQTGVAARGGAHLLPKPSTRELATERECSELRLRLATAEGRLKHSARENAMLNQALALALQANKAQVAAVVEERGEAPEPAAGPGGARKEGKRLQTNNVNIGRLVHPAEAVHPAEFAGVDGFMLFQRILTRHRAESGKTLLEEMRADLADVADVVNGRYSRYVVQQANQSSQCRVCFAPEQTCMHPECPAEIKRASIVSLPAWAQQLEQVIRSSVFPYMQPALDLKEDAQTAIAASSEYSSKLAKGHNPEQPSGDLIGGHTVLPGGEPTLFHHMVVNYSANLEPHHDPPYLGHVIVSSSLQPADLVLSNPHSGPQETHRIHLAAGDIYVLMGDARYKWIHEIQLSEEAVRTSVVSRYWLSGHEFKECKWDPRSHSWWREINGASAL